MAAAPVASTAVAAGVRTPGQGSFSDPTQVGTMIQKMYPQYANFDPATLGQRWIDVHTPKASVGMGAGGAGTDTLQGPGTIGTTDLTSTNPNQNVPDLSGLSRFATPIKQQPKQAQVKIAPAIGVGNQLSGGNQLASQPQQQNAPWIGSQIMNGVSNFFKAPNLQAQSKPPGY